MAYSDDKSGQLWQAATDGELDSAKLLLEDPAVNVNWVGQERWDTPLHRACRFGRKEVVLELLSHPNIEVNKGNLGLGTPFYIACQEGHKETVKVLMADPRVDVNSPQDEEATPFSVACQNGRGDVVELLMGDPRVNVAKPDFESYSSFWTACGNGHLGVVVVLLLDQRIDINLPANDNTSPLWITSQNGHLLAAKFILASGRPVDTRMVSSFNHRTAAAQGRAMGVKLREEGEAEEIYLRRRTSGPLIAELVDRFEADPVGVRVSLREEPILRRNRAPLTLFPARGPDLPLFFTLQSSLLGTCSPWWCSSQTGSWSWGRTPHPARKGSSVSLPPCPWTFR